MNRSYLPCRGMFLTGSPQSIFELNEHMERVKVAHERTWLSRNDWSEFDKIMMARIYNETIKPLREIILDEQEIRDFNTQ